MRKNDFEFYWIKSDGRILNVTREKASRVRKNHNSLIVGIYQSAIGIWKGWEDCIVLSGKQKDAFLKALDIECNESPLKKLLVDD